MAPVIETAPLLRDFLGEASKAHFDAVLKTLDAHGVAYTVNPRLVRGLDYYNLTVFEWVTDRLGAQGTVCGGGRYDTLIEQMGGKPAPASGFAIGVERLIELLKEVAPPALPSVLDVYLVRWGENSQPHALSLAEDCRTHGLSVQMHCGEGSLKSQMKKADQSGASVAILMGDDERANNVVTIKPLRGQPGLTQQDQVAMSSAASVVRDMVSNSK
jgi:histidyl-tRNA synthetase